MSKVSESKGIALFGKKDAAIPEHVKSGGGRGNEQVSAKDQLIPQIKLVQAINLASMKAITKGKAEIGSLLNSSTNEVHDEIYVINLYFKKSFTIWKSRKMGGGKMGEFYSEAEAQAALADLPAMPSDMPYDVTETHQHLCLLLDVDSEKGTAKVKSPCQFYFKKTSQKVSASWNTNIAAQGGDRFASVWHITSVDESNKSGDTYKNFQIEFAGWAPEDIFKEAEKIYDGIVGNVKPTEESVA